MWIAFLTRFCVSDMRNVSTDRELAKVRQAEHSMETKEDKEANRSHVGNTVLAESTHLCKYHLLRINYPRTLCVLTRRSSCGRGFSAGMTQC